MKCSHAFFQAVDDERVWECIVCCKVEIRTEVTAWQ